MVNTISAATSLKRLLRTAQSRSILMNPRLSIFVAPCAPPPNWLNMANDALKPAVTLGRSVSRPFQSKSACRRNLTPKPRFAAYDPVKDSGSANLLYCAIVPLFCGPPLAVMMAVSSAKDMRRISATIATASLKSSKSIRRSPLSLTLEKMRSTCTGVRDRLFCKPVSLQNLAHMLPSIVSSCAAPPARPKLAKERKVLRRVANRPDPPRDAPISGSESESSGRFSNARSPSEDLCIVDRAGIESCQRRCQRSCQRAIRTGGNGRVIIIDCRGKNWRVIVA